LQDAFKKSDRGGIQKNGAVFVPEDARGSWRERREIRGVGGMKGEITWQVRNKCM